MFTIDHNIGRQNIQGLARKNRRLSDTQSLDQWGRHLHLGLGRQTINRGFVDRGTSEHLRLRLEHRSQAMFVRFLLNNVNGKQRVRR